VRATVQQRNMPASSHVPAVCRSQCVLYVSRTIAAMQSNGNLCLSQYGNLPAAGVSALCVQLTAEWSAAAHLVCPKHMYVYRYMHAGGRSNAGNVGGANVYACCTCPHPLCSHHQHPEALNDETPPPVWLLPTQCGTRGTPTTLSH
jgi:hypothetical protein